MVKQFLPHLKTKSAAAIMNVSSGLAFVPLPISPVYCATKAGLHSFTESLRVQLKNIKVKVCGSAPRQSGAKVAQQERHGDGCNLRRGLQLEQPFLRNVESGIGHDSVKLSRRG